MNYLHMTFLLFCISHMNAHPMNQIQIPANSTKPIDFKNSTTRTTADSFYHNDDSTTKKISKTFENDFLDVLTIKAQDRKEVAEKSARKDSSSERPKRALIFRPMFVYNQQQVRRQRVQPSRRPNYAQPPQRG